MVKRVVKAMKCTQLEVGKVINTHGIKGEVKVMPWTDVPEQFEEFDWVYVKKNDWLIKLNIEQLKYQKNNLIIKFKEINSLNDAEMYKNAILVVNREMIGEPPAGRYYICDLIGMEVITESGEKIGILDDVINTGSNDIYIVKNDFHKEIMIPALKDVIINVDVGNNTMVVKLHEGLIE